MKFISTRTFIVLSAICFFCYAPAITFAQWQQLTGLKGEPCYFINSTSTELFTGISAGVLKSSNSGTSWAKEPDLYLTNVTGRISTSGDTIAVYADPDSYLSTDNGATWSEINSPAGGAVFVANLVTEDGMLYAGTDGDYLYKSDDWGANWTQVISNITAPTINFTAASGNSVFLATDSGVFVSADQGVTFNLTTTAFPGAYQFVYSNGTYAFAFGDNGMIKSSNNGATWNDFNSPFLYSQVTDMLIDGSTVFAATYDQLIQTDISAANWTEVNFNQSVDFCFGLCKKGSVMYASTNRGVFATSDLGMTWAEKNDGIIPMTIDGLAWHGDAVFAGASIYGVSDYSNNTWNFSGLPLLNSFDLVSGGSDIYSASDLGIYKSLDTGVTWNIITPLSGPLAAFCVKVAVSDSLVLGAAIQSGVLRSGDYGVNWSLENNGLVNTQVSCIAVSGNNIIVGTYANGVYISTDAGFTWSFSTAPGEYISDITAIGSNVLASTYGSSGCYLSTDNGATWNPLNTVSFDDLTTSGSLVLANTTSEVYLSEDNGVSFLPAIPGPAGVAIANSVASDSTLYVSTYTNGVWMASISELLSVPDVIQSAGIKLTPNIFTDETLIIADDAIVAKQPMLIITDVNGQTVRKIRLQQNTTRFQSNGLAAGVYFCMIMDKGLRIKTQKFIIM